MSDRKHLAEAAPAYDAGVTNLGTPVIIEREGQPVAVVISFEEYKRLRDLEAQQALRHNAGWETLEAVLAQVHSRPTGLTPDEIEAEIGAARQERRHQRHASQRSS